MTTRLRIVRLNERRARVEVAMLASLSVPYVRKCGRLLERMDAIGNGLRTRAFCNRTHRVLDALPQMFGAAR